MLGVGACAWRVKGEAGTQKSDQVILELSNISILNSNIIIMNDEIITYNSSSDRIFLLRKINESYLELH